tara:strand:+ start:1039 stop:1881 length:843 start_codon:yes stop_codon:yes gene_type:complete
VCVYAACNGSTNVYFDYAENATEASCLALDTDSHFFPANMVEESQIDFHVSPDRCSQSKDVNITTNWTQYTLTFDVPELQGKVVGNVGNDYLAVQFWTHERNGSCSMSTFDANYPATPRGDTPGTNLCTGNAVCEPCHSNRFTSTHYEGTLDLAQVQMERGNKFTKFHRKTTRQEIDSCKRYYELSECNHISVSKPFLGAMTSGLKDTVQLQEEKRVTPQVTIYDTTYENASAVAVSDITSGQFVLTANAGTAKGKSALDFTYEADAELYRYNEQVAVLE